MSATIVDRRTSEVATPTLVELLAIGPDCQGVARGQRALWSQSSSRLMSEGGSADSVLTLFASLSVDALPSSQE